MNIKSYLKTTLILLAVSLFLQNCKDKDINGPCNKYYTINQSYQDNLLFDYKHTDTLLYKRTINNVVKDTLVFVKQRSYRDTLLFDNQDIAGNETCNGGDFTRERIGWDYSCQYDSIVFNVQVVAGGEGGDGNEDYMVHLKNKLHIYNLMGASIGNFGVDFLSNYSTSEKTYDFTWDAPCVTSNQYLDYGDFNYGIRKKTNWFYYYNIGHGIIEISKTDRTEVWELIP